VSRREIRWVVRPGEGGTLGDVVLRAGGDADAVRDGRVFVGRRRATSASEPVQPGDELRITLDAAAPGEAVVLAEEDGILAVDKPAGMPTIPDLGGSSHALVARVAAARGLTADGLHPTSRLDRDVSGVVVFATSASARERLASARARGEYARLYVAVAARAPSPPAGVWTVAIGRAADPRHRAAGGRDAVPAESRYAVRATAGGRALLALEPVTGRTHQLRVHAAHGGAPLLGDRVYGGAGAGRVALDSGRVLALPRVALHARRVVVPRADGSLLTVVAPIPAELAELWAALGGDPDDLAL